jgi:hypothetical protein
LAESSRPARQANIATLLDDAILASSDNLNRKGKLRVILRAFT